MKEFEPFKKPTSIEKVVATIRIDNTMLDEIDKLANEIDISRNELINQCVEYALTNLEFKDNKGKKKTISIMLTVFILITIFILNKEKEQ